MVLPGSPSVFLREPVTHPHSQPHRHSSPSPTLSATPTFTSTATWTPTPTSSATLTITPTSTPAWLGVVEETYSAFREPNASATYYLATLRAGQTVRILQEKQIGEEKWYLCQWNDNNLMLQGWVQAVRVTLINFPGVSQPTPFTPTSTPTLLPGLTPTP